MAIYIASVTALPATVTNLKAHDAVIGSGYVGVYSPPTDGLLVEGDFGVGVTIPTHQIHLKLRGDDNIFIDGRTNVRTVTPGAMRFEHTAGIVGTRAINLDIDMAGFADTHAINTDFTATSMVAGQEVHINDVHVITNGATGGAIAGYTISKTGSGSADVYGLEVYPGVNVLEQYSGAVIDIEQAWIYDGSFTDSTVAFNSAATDLQIFANNGDYIYFGQAAKFSVIEIALAIVASGAGVKPAFAFSDGVGGFTAFGASDGTNGFKNQGSISWNSSDLIGWATDTVNAVGSKYWIRIERTQNSLTTPPTEDTMRVVSPTEFWWDDLGKLSVAAMATGGVTNLNDLDIANGIAVGTYAGVNVANAGNIIMSGKLGVATNNPGTYSARIGGAIAGDLDSLQLVNGLATTTDRGISLSFATVGFVETGRISNKMTGAAITEAYLQFQCVDGGSLGEVMKISSDGSVYLPEKAAANTDETGKGQLWIKTGSPNTIWFTDAAGTDHQLAYV